MKRKKKILIAVAVIIVAIQFFQPAKKTFLPAQENAISNAVYVPENVQVLLKGACYDCHSDNTVYPWYYRVQPVGWFLAYHIRAAREHMNFSEFGKYDTRRQMNKLEGIDEEIRDNGMPLLSYRLMHKKARLTKSDKTLIIDWSRAAQDTLKSKP